MEPLARWLPLNRVRLPGARLRLFCLPYAGGSAAAYREWSAALPAGVEVCPLELPGRAGRMREPPFERSAALAEAVAEALRPELDRPFALFGHSMGALLAFEVARRLRDARASEPGALFVSGRNAPQIPVDDPTTHLLPDAELVERLRALNGTPPEVLEHPELLELILPTLRADFAVVETHVHAPCAPFDVPLVVFGGERDPEVHLAGLEAWRAHARGAFRLRLFPGDHFFLHAEQAAVLRALSEELRALLI